MISKEIINVWEETYTNSWHCQPEVMPHYHRHEGIELNFLEQGSMTYLFAGREITVEAGRLVVFWATFPHRVTWRTEDCLFFYFTFSLAQFLHWHLPGNLTSAVLNGGLVVDNHIENAKIDRALLLRWHNEIANPCTEQKKIFHLELEARLRRMAHDNSDPAYVPKNEVCNQPSTRNTREMEKVAQMTSLIVERYTENLNVGDIAKQVGLNPKYAMALFRKNFGMTIVEYITEHRLLHAQRLLATTDSNILDIAFDSGFGSVSRFYEVFEPACGKSPSEFRNALRTRR